MIISKYVIWFVIFSFMGWIFETTYCCIHESKWENRGFLYMPLLPIYGVGATAISAIYEHLYLFDMNDLSNLQLFAIGYVGSIFLEYGTSWFLEKRFHALWWDYSDMPLNVHGRVCVPASIGFGLAGILVIRVLMPFVATITANIHPLLMECISLACVGVLGGDTALTISALTNFEKELQTMEENINQHMALFVNSIAEKTLDAQILIEEERQNFSLQNFERMARRLGNSRVSAVKRVKRFSKNTLPSKTYFQMDRVYNFLKKKSNIIRKNKQA